MYCEYIFRVTGRYIDMPYDRYVFNNCKFYYHALTIRYTSSQIFVHGNLLNFSSNKLSICIFISGKTMNPIHSQMTTLSETYICT